MYTYTLNSIDLDNNVVHVSATITKGFGNEWHLKDGTKTTSVTMRNHI